ncbi:unnamed protein product [Zymoseptoria tritici ST99CH_3D7]|uniref:ZZ-type domain-containing protein n=1 Tax=Zymoseptoria tritici (strain ST99CH_3D7) TaxID=1276538 RepID=A0A1X7RD42_ZYMT9|nr:unnamed protein product [Zymoseptoria tritici ST99CH_3D7]
MAAPHAVTIDTPIVIKIAVNGQLKKLKLPLKDLGASVLPDKLRQVLDIKPEQHVQLERYSDSAGGYITLDESNPQVFKTLIRAAKAKLKLRLKATVTPANMPAELEDKKEIKKEVVEEKEPVIVSTPAKMPEETDNTTRQITNSLRDSTAFDRRSVGSGIFQFREARASQQTLVNEAPVPQPFTDRTPQLFDHPDKPFALRPREVITPAVIPGHSWSVYCNECDKPMANAHYHCSICDSGDFDLCEECVGKNKHCRGEGHWLIKRFIKDGSVVASETERISRKPAPAPAVTKPEAEMPGSFVTEQSKMLSEEVPTPTRTCNNCVVVLPEQEFVTCIDCDDFDLCINCHTADKHGHHPAHAFEAATPDMILPLAAEMKLTAGRNVRHHAICDGCNKNIYGVRHKCMNCPDWDYCNDCVKNARSTHPRHRFAPLYKPIASPVQPTVRHFGIYCDGPLCEGQSKPSYIHGVRYKCTICHDTDFCAACEALPGNHHNRTHPLIKLKTPVRNVNVSTENEDLRGNVRVMGDRRSTSPVESTSANAAAPVQTVAEIMPTEVKNEETMPIPIPVKNFVEKVTVEAPASVPATNAALLNAHFVKDIVPDGMKFLPEVRFTQTWTLVNPGPTPWPAGCSVRYVGGDNMLNVDNAHPASVAAIADATESNVVGRPVATGEQVSFTVTLKAPSREGKSISYWRLKAADGTPFGHRLWCDIEVQKPEGSVSSAPAASVSEAMHSLQGMHSRCLIPAHRLADHAREMSSQGGRHHLPQIQAQLDAQMQARQQQAQIDAQAQRLVAQQEQVKRLQAEALARQLRNQNDVHALQQQMQVNQRVQQAQQQTQQQAEIANGREAQLALMQRIQTQRQAQLQAQQQAQQTHQAALQQYQSRLTQPSFLAQSNANAPIPGAAASASASASNEGSQLAARFAAMREQQKSRREQMIAQMNAQREHLQQQDTSRAKAAVARENYQRATETEGDKERREALKLRVAHIKANILKTRVEREQAEKAEKKAKDNEKVQNILAQLAKTEDKAEDKSEEKTEEKTDEKLSDSQMVFPKLDKESPSSSTYESATSSTLKAKAKAAYVENENGEVETTATPAASAPVELASPSVEADDGFVDLDDDDLEVFSADGDDSDEEGDGFMTDEEYDILDASDTETVASGWRA